MRTPDETSERCEKIALYLVETSSTVRKTAKRFGISKSTVHKDIRDRLKSVNYPLYKEAVRVLNRNKSERHIRGGIATRNKYLKMKRK